MIERKKEGLLTTLRIKTKPMPPREGTKSIKIKITQRDVDKLNQNIAKETKENEERRIKGHEICQKRNNFIAL